MPHIYSNELESEITTEGMPLCIRNPSIQPDDSMHPMARLDT